LSIVKGTLTDAQRLKINEHAEMSTKMLSQIPFTRKLRRVPEIAGAHHEKLDGSGYPQGLSGEEISLQARILAIADIFESLSADDRPYREQPLPRAAVLEIMQSMVDAGHIDSDLYELFIRERIDAELDRIKSETKPRAV